MLGIIWKRTASVILLMCDILTSSLFIHRCIHFTKEKGADYPISLDVKSWLVLSLLADCHSLPIRDGQLRLRRGRSAPGAEWSGAESERSIFFRSANSSIFSFTRSVENRKYLRHL